MTDNWIYCYPMGRLDWYAPRMHYARDAKEFAVLLWSTGAFRRIAVVSKREQVTWERGAKLEGDEA